jgi:transcriptional regulator with XRE-family HTH domain
MTRYGADMEGGGRKGRVMVDPLMSPAQCRAARALLAWSQTVLAQRAGLSRRTIADYELGKRRLHSRNLRELVRAFTTAGVQLISAEGMEHVIGVRLTGDFAPQPTP